MYTFRHLGIVVKDMTSSLSFYRDVLGLRVIYDEIEEGPFITRLIGLPNVKRHIVKLQDANSVVIEFLEDLNSKGEQSAHPPSPNHIGLNHIALNVDDLEQKYKELKKHGVRFVSPPIISPAGKVKVLYCYSPDDIIMELVETLN